MSALTTKFVKAHRCGSVGAPISGINHARWIHKLMYEFWGFCVNGGNDLHYPGGFAPFSSSILFPDRWQSGSAVLLASGSDGTTTLGNKVLEAPSINWTSGSLVGKHVVLWKSGSSSTDDSIYEITQILGSSSVLLNTNTGATAYTGSLKPYFTTRSSINFRVVDFAASIALPGFSTTDNGLVLQFNAANLINSGQHPTPQCRTRINQFSSFYSIALTLSPSGSWTPASSSGYFPEPTLELKGDDTGGGWGQHGTTGNGHVTLIGAQDFLLCNTRSPSAAANSFFHIEIPHRIYAQAIDPNPFCVINAGTVGFRTYETNADKKNYSSGVFAENPYTGLTLSHQSMIRSISGDSFQTDQYPSLTINSTVNGRYTEAFFNVQQNKLLTFEIGCGSNTDRSYSAMRFKLRRARVIANIIPKFTRIGDSGEWLYVGGNILWPWDNSILPYNLFPEGS